RSFQAAAALLLLVASGVFVYWQYARVVPPEVSEQVKTVMQQSREMGRQEAELQPLKTTKAAFEKGDAGMDEQSLQPTDGSAAADQLLDACRVTTFQDKEFWLTLADGTLVHLNYNTRLIYPERFVGGSRDVVCDGEAYFMVAKDRRHPFIVHTPHGEVKVYGTEFNVNTRNECSEVVLVKGSVSVTPDDGEERRLTPGQKSVVHDGRMEVSEVDTSPYTAWNTGTFVFEDYPLEQLMDVLAHWYGCRPQFHSEQAKQMRFTGELDKYGSIEPTLDAISAVTGLTILYDGREVIIRDRE
ncbi:MAG: FecR domain-containing protein, partial [Prevotella sp.]|nr:FecR domain-containing protein [Prevotella sp.]